MSDAMRVPGHVAFPFTIRRSSDVIGDEITSTRERVHGLLRFSADGLRVQWRLSRSTERIGSQIRTDREIEAVRELYVPLHALGGATVRWIWHRWPPGRYLVITAADLRAFEEVGGLTGLQLDHPAELTVRIPRGALLAAREFAGEVELALADRALHEADQPQRMEADTEGAGDLSRGADPGAGLPPAVGDLPPGRPTDRTAEG